RGRAGRGRGGEGAEVLPACADGEELADLVRVLAAVHRCREERSVTDDQATTAFAAGGGVVAVERGQLQDLLAVDEKDLAHERRRIAVVILRGPVGIET